MKVTPFKIVGFKVDISPKGVSLMNCNTPAEGCPRGGLEVASLIRRRTPLEQGGAAALEARGAHVRVVVMVFF